MATKRKMPTREVAKLEKALCALADNEGLVKAALRSNGFSDGALGDMCQALRSIVDDGFRGEG